MFDALPDAARVWTFLADRPASEEVRDRFSSAMAPFLAGWASHGRPVPAEATWVEDRFFVVAAHIGEGVNAGVSGCGIDALTHAAEAAAEALGFTWADGLQVAFRDGEGLVRIVPRATFRALVREGGVGPETPVFDLTVDRLGALREAGLERPAGASWHARAFRIGVAA